MLTKSKVLSNKILSNAGLDISGSKLNNVVNNNITLTSKSTVNRSVENPYDGITIVSPEHKEQNTETTECEDTGANEIKVSYSDPFGLDILKKIINLYSSNVLKLEGKLVIHNAELIDLIKSIMDTKCNTEMNVEIDIDYEINCCGASKGLNYINKILIKDSNETRAVDMKYKYNEEYNAIQQYGISLKYTLD